MIFWADLRITSGVIFVRSTCCPSLLTSVSWMYNRTSFFSRGITMTLPDAALCMAHRIRMSADKIVSIGSRGGEGGRHTEIGDWNYVKNTPNKVRLLAFHCKTKLPSGPAMGAVATDHVLGTNDFGATLLAPAPSDQVISVIFGQVTSKKAVWHVCTVLSWCGLVIIQMLYFDLNWIGVIVL